MTTSDETASIVAAVFSGVCFFGLAVWLIVSNGTKLAYIQRASLEKRLQTCCFINAYIACFSTFFNFFQLTKADDLVLPDSDSAVVDLARPVEWISTCPLMQLVLVLLGGSRIPEYRRTLMPSLAAFVIGTGTASLMLQGPLKMSMYVIASIACAIMFSFIRKQVEEHSNGEEDIFCGESEFRKASFLLVATWFPFPIWFALSPEGFGVIRHMLVIQGGWAFLNITSKFSFIFYIQKIKDNYCNRLKVKREFCSIAPVSCDGTAIMVPQNGGGGMARKEGELSAIIMETMSFLGMVQHADRLNRLLQRAEIHDAASLEKLSKYQCDSLQLPYDLVSMVQRRLKIWRMEMQDDAELTIEAGERHYQSEEDQLQDRPVLFTPDDDGGRPLSPVQRFRPTSPQSTKVCLRTPSTQSLNTCEAVDSLVADAKETFRRMEEIVSKSFQENAQGTASPAINEDDMLRRMEQYLGRIMEEQLADSLQRMQSSTDRMHKYFEQSFSNMELKLESACKSFDSHAHNHQQTLTENMVKLQTLMTDALAVQKLNAQKQDVPTLSVDHDAIDRAMANLASDVAKRTDVGITTLQTKLELQHAVILHKISEWETKVTGKVQSLETTTHMISSKIESAANLTGSDCNEQFENVQKVMAQHFMALDQTQIKHRDATEAHISTCVANSITTLCNSSAVAHADLKGLGAAAQESRETEALMQTEISQIKQALKEMLNNETEAIGDVRRVCIMGLDKATCANDCVQSCSAKLDDVVALLSDSQESTMVIGGNKLLSSPRPSSPRQPSNGERRRRTSSGTVV